MATTIHVQLEGYTDSDFEERAELAWALHDELRDLDAAEVTRPADTAPDGAKGNALEWATLVVTLAGSLPPLFTALRGWLSRHPGASITVEIAGDSLTLEDASAVQQQQLIDSWLVRHEP
jgi:hypothetical protein